MIKVAIERLLAIALLEISGDKSRRKSALEIAPKCGEIAGWCGGIAERCL